MAIVSRLYRYPVKGLSPEALTGVDLDVGRGVPLDRVFALAVAGGAAGRSTTWRPKSDFATLTTHERLAALDTVYDPESGVLSVRRGGKVVARGALGTPVGRAMVEDFFRAYLKTSSTSPPRIVGGPAGVPLTDNPEPAVALVGLASVADLERVVGRPVDPLRFRANVYIEGIAPWEELAWIGREIVLGTARLRVTERIGRCAATDVEPGTGVRDLAIARSLRGAFGHVDCGVLATVTGAGRVTPGDAVSLDAPAG